MDLRERIRTEVEKIFPRMIELRRAINAHPETAYEELRTSGPIASELKKHGIVDGLHTPLFSIDEVALKTGAGIPAYLTIEYLRSH